MRAEPRRWCRLFLLGLVALVLAACQPPGPAVHWEVTRSLSPPAVSRLKPVPTEGQAGPTAVVPQDPTPETVVQSGEPDEVDPWEALQVEALAARTYGGGEIRIVEALGETSAYTRRLFVYPSDGLDIYGFVNEPKGEGPFPVVIALHGYVDPAGYETLDYTTRYADALAQAGFLVLHPNLRGYPPSDDGPNLFRVGMAVDVLNLIALVREGAGLPGPLERADGQAIGLWGHSMGGGISLRVLAVSPDLDGAVLYGSMSGDEVRNFTKILEWSEGARGWEELAIPDPILTKISPINYLHRINAPLSVHHGEADELVPIEWSLELCERLSSMQAEIDCYTYPGQPHTFFGESDQLFITRTVEFFTRALAGP